MFVLQAISFPNYWDGNEMLKSSINVQPNHSNKRLSAASNVKWIVEILGTNLLVIVINSMRNLGNLQILDKLLCK